MKLIFKQVLLVLFVVLVYSGCGERRPYVLANTVLIEYRDTLRVDDWIMIDGIKFTHVDDYDMLKEDTVNINRVFDDNVLPATNQRVIIDGATSDDLTGNTPTSEVAAALFQALSLSSLNDLGQFYGFSGHILELSAGKFTFYRKDGKKIKVSTSEGYTGIIRKVD